MIRPIRANGSGASLRLRTSHALPKWLLDHSLPIALISCFIASTTGLLSSPLALAGSSSEPLCINIRNASIEVKPDTLEGLSEIDKLNIEFLRTVRPLPELPPTSKLFVVMLPRPHPNAPPRLMTLFVSNPLCGTSCTGFAVVRQPPYPRGMPPAIVRFRFRHNIVIRPWNEPPTFHEPPFSDAYSVSYRFDSIVLQAEQFGFAWDISETWIGPSTAFSREPPFTTVNELINNLKERVSNVGLVPLDEIGLGGHVDLMLKCLE